MSWEDLTTQLDMVYLHFRKNMLMAEEKQCTQEETDQEVSTITKMRQGSSLNESGRSKNEISGQIQGVIWRTS